MTDGRQIAIVRDYDALIAVLRQRAAELHVRRETLDSVAGLQSGYSAKLLAHVPARSLGRVSLGPMLQTLGLAIVVIEDQAALAKVQHRFGAVERNTTPSDGKHEVIQIRVSRKKLKRMARIGGKARAARLTARERHRIAKRAAKMRWARSGKSSTVANRRRRKKYIGRALPGFLYVIAGSSNRVKIGRSLDPQRRFLSLLTQSPDSNLALKYYVAVPNMARAERAVHKELSQYRAHGEWFEIDADMAIAAVINQAQNRKRSTRPVIGARVARVVLPEPCAS